MVLKPNDHGSAEEGQHEAEPEAKVSAWTEEHGPARLEAHAPTNRWVFTQKLVWTELNTKQ